MSSHESILWVVVKEPTLAHPKYVDGILPEYFVFRTLRKATDFRSAKLKHTSKRWRWMRPVRAKWGPDNVRK